MEVKGESEKVGLKLNIQKTKIMASSPITSWQIDGETMEAVEYILFRYTGSILQDRSQLSHSKIKNIEILSSMFSTRMLCDQNINYKKNTEKI